MHLDQNWPNPFNPTTNIRFALPRRAPVSLTIYHVSGRRVRKLINGTVDSGEHVVVWDGKDEGGRPAASGVYFCRLSVGREARLNRLVLLR